MPVERGDSNSAVGATIDDSPSTFEQSTLGGTTTTGNARLIVRDATQISVIDTNNVWASNTVEGVLDEIAALTGLNSAVQDQIDALDIRVTTNEGDISTNVAGIINLDTRVTTNEGDISALDVRVTDNEGDISTNTTNIATNTADIITANDLAIAYAIALGG